jgi:hypothetical protein
MMAQKKDLCPYTGEVMGILHGMLFKETISEDQGNTDVVCPPDVV